MSNTGTYIYDKRLKKVIKISNKVTDSGVFSDVTFKDPFITSDINGSPIEVKSRRHKRDLMKAHGLREAPGGGNMAAETTRKRRGGCSQEFVRNTLERAGLLQKWNRHN